MINTAIIGTGNYGSQEAAKVKAHPDLKLVAGCDLNKDNLKKFTERFNCNGYLDANEMFAKKKIDLIIIATTNAGHAPNVLLAIKNGVPNVMCEKPLSMDMDAAHKMVEAAEQHGTRTNMGFGWGIKDYQLYIEKLIAEGKLGKILKVFMHCYRGYGFWNKEHLKNGDGSCCHHPAVVHPGISGGWTVHHACHQIFALSRLCGKAVSVFGQMQNTSYKAGSEEVTSGMVMFESGAVGHFIDSLGAFRGMRAGIIGTDGTIEVTDPHNRIPEENIEIRIRYEGKREDEVIIMHYRKDEYTRLQEMVDAIKADKPSPVPFRLGMENLKICMGARESAGKNKVIYL